MPTGKDCDKCKEKVLALINNEQTNFTAEDEAWLNTLEESALDKLTPEKEQPKKAPEVNKEEDKKPLTTDEYLQAMPQEVRDQFETGLRLNAEKRTTLIANILKKAPKAGWTEAMLKTKDTKDLEMISNSIPDPVDYSGQGFGPVPEIEVNEEEVAPMAPTGIEFNKENK